MMEQLDNQDDALLSAYLDGELADADADKITERLAREPQLMQRLEALRGADDATRAVFKALDDTPMPDKVLEMLGAADQRPKAEVISFPRRVMQNFTQMPVAIAASVALVAGFLVNDLMREAPSPSGAFDLYQAGTVAEGSDLYKLLEHGVSAQPQRLANGATGELLLTFEDKAGDFCRQLAIGSDERGAHGVACRRGDNWQLEALSFSGPESASGPYQQASADTPAAVESAVDSLIGARDPLDVDEEKRLISNSWRKPEE